MDRARAAAKLDRRKGPSRRHLQTWNGSLRRLLVGGAMAAMFRTKVLQNDAWLCQLRARKPAKVAAVALANKIARTAWAVMQHGQDWRPATALSSRPQEPAAVLAAVKTMPPSAMAFGQS